MLSTLANIQRKIDLQMYFKAKKPHNLLAEVLKKDNANP